MTGTSQSLRHTLDDIQRDLSNWRTDLVKHSGLRFLHIPFQSYANHLVKGISQKVAVRQFSHRAESYDLTLDDLQ